MPDLFEEWRAAQRPGGPIDWAECRSAWETATAAERERCSKMTDDLAYNTVNRVVVAMLEDLARVMRNGI